MPFDVRSCAAAWENRIRSWDATRQQEEFGKALSGDEIAAYATGIAQEMARVSAIMDNFGVDLDAAMEMYAARQKTPCKESVEEDENGTPENVKRGALIRCVVRAGRTLAVPLCDIGDIPVVGRLTEAEANAMWTRCLRFLKPNEESLAEFAEGLFEEVPLFAHDPQYTQDDYLLWVGTEGDEVHLSVSRRAEAN
jgi:hypothetical protein